MVIETAPPTPVVTAFSRKNPFPAPLLKRQRLDGAGSEKQTFHYEVSLQESGLIFEPGDSLAVFPQNAAELVDEIIGLLGFAGEEEVTGVSGESIPLRHALQRDRTITTPSRQFVQLVAERIPAAHFL